MNRIIYIIILIISIPISILAQDSDTICIDKKNMLEKIVTDSPSLIQQDNIKQDSIKLNTNIQDTIPLYIIESSEKRSTGMNIKKWLIFADSIYEYKEVIVVILTLLVIIISSIIHLIKIFKDCYCTDASKKHKEGTSIDKTDNIKGKLSVSTPMQVILIALMVLICVFSASSWSYLALVALCILSLDKYNRGLLGKFSKVAAALQGKDLDLTPLTAKEVDDKSHTEIYESMDGNITAQSSPVTTSQQFSQSTNYHVQEYKDVENLALQYLEKQYPNLQKLLRLRLNSTERIELDGLVQNEHNNIVIEIKYCSHACTYKRHIRRLQEAVEFIAFKTKKRTELLLFIVANTSATKQQLINLYNTQLPDDMISQVRIFTKREIETLIKNKG